MTVARALRMLSEAFTFSGSTTARLDAEVILSHVLGCERYKLITLDAQTLSEKQIEQILHARKRRIAGEPIAYIIGKKEFYSLEFTVNSHVLVPRPETELLVELTINHAPESGTVLDVGTGSGAIAVAVKHQRPDCLVSASDISSGAIRLAKLNAKKILGTEAIEFRQGDLFMPWGGERFDIIVSNPPYIGYEEKDALPKELMFEPEISLFCDESGRSIIFRLIDEAEKYLHAGGKVLIEIGAGMSDDVANRARSRGYCVSVYKDYAGLPRVVLLQK